MQLLATKHIRMTAYHPIANGLVECLHHQLRASLKAQPDPSNWTESLPRYYLASVSLSRKTSTALLQSLCMVLHSACPVSSSVHLPQTLTLLHSYSASSPPCSSFMLHLSVFIIALFTFQTASPHVYMSLSDMMPSASRYNIPMMAHTRYLMRTQTLHLRHSRPLIYCLLGSSRAHTPWTTSYVSISCTTIQHAAYPWAKAQPPQHLHHELLVLDDTFAALIVFITENWPSLWWESICGVQYTHTPFTRTT